MASEAEIRPKAAAREEPGAGFSAWVYSAFFLILPLQAVVAPKSIVATLLAAALLGLFAAWRGGLARAGTIRTWAIRTGAIRTGAMRTGAALDRGLALGLGLLVLWCAIASAWSFEPTRSLLLAVRLGGIFLAALALHALMRGIASEALRRRFGRCLAAGVCLGLGVMAIELAFGFPIGTAFRGAEALGGDPAVWLNRGATALAILCWPAAAVLWQARSKGAAVALVLAAFGVLAFSSSLAAALAVAAAAAVAACALAVPRLGRVLVVLATLGAVIGSPVLAQMSYKYDWQSAGWLPFSAQHRVEIWHFSLERSLERPLAGWGFDSARGMKRVAGDLEPSGRSPVALHPHNAPLQVLLELGLVGMAIALGLAWLLIRRLETLPHPQRAFAQATYVSALVIACASFGMWQNWWIALMCCAAVMSAAGAGARPRTGAPG